LAWTGSLYRRASPTETKVDHTGIDDMTEKVNHGQISLESLKTLGGFVPNAPVQREIEWADGLVTVYVR